MMSKSYFCNRWVIKELHTPWCCKLSLLRLVVDHLWFQTPQETMSHLSRYFAESLEWTSLRPCSWKQNSVMVAIKNKHHSVDCSTSIEKWQRQFKNVSKSIRVISWHTLLNYHFKDNMAFKAPITKFVHLLTRMYTKVCWKINRCLINNN